MQQCAGQRRIQGTRRHVGDTDLEDAAERRAYRLVVHERRLVGTGHVGRSGRHTADTPRRMESRPVVDGADRGRKRLRGLSLSVDDQGHEGDLVLRLRTGARRRRDRGVLHRFPHRRPVRRRWRQWTDQRPGEGPWRLTGRSEPRVGVRVGQSPGDDVSHLRRRTELSGIRPRWRREGSQPCNRGLLGGARGGPSLGRPLAVSEPADRTHREPDGRRMPLSLEQLDARARRASSVAGVRRSAVSRSLHHGWRSLAGKR